MEESKNFTTIDLVLGPIGVYLLLLKGVVVYAGQSTNIFARIANHYQNLQRVKQGKRPYIHSIGTPSFAVPFDSVKIMLCQRQDLDKEEFALIQQYRPRHNTLLNRPITRVESGIKDLPCIQALIKKASEREQSLATTIKRRRLPPSILEIERSYQETRDKRMPITMPKLKCLEDGPE